MKRKICLMLAGVLAVLAAGCSAGTPGEEGIVRIAFADGGITAPETDGCEVDGTELTITEPGSYLLTGSCPDGLVKVKKGVEGVRLILSGLTLQSKTSAPIVCGRSSVVTIEAAAGTQNTLRDTEKNNNESHSKNKKAENAVIKCRDGAQVTLCGTGSLTIESSGKNGIKSGTRDTESGQDAFLTIREMALTVEAAENDAINAEQLLNIESGTLVLDTPSKALHCDYTLNIGGEGTEGPDITIGSAYEGLEAAEVNIHSGHLDITSTDDCINAANSELAGYDFAIRISGGSIRAYASEGDGFDANGSIAISGGEVQVWTANTADNQPLDADDLVDITGGTVLAIGGSSGMGTSIHAEQPYAVFGDTQRFDPQQAQNKQAIFAKGSEFAIASADGAVLYTGTALCGVSYAAYTSPNLADGAEYTLTAGDTRLQANAQTGTTIQQEMPGPPPKDAP